MMWSPDLMDVDDVQFCRWLDCTNTLPPGASRDCHFQDFWARRIVMLGTSPQKGVLR